MTKELTTVKPNQELVAVGNQIDEIVNECLPVIAQENQNFVQALTLANGIKELRHIFLTDPNIKETVESMQNTHLGFMTDRTDLAIWKSQQPGAKKEIKAYRYKDVAEVCIEAMLKGYRITNNEFNILVGRFYAAKNGKFRRIQECKGVTDFHFTTTSPAYENERGGVQYAKVQAFASWKKDGQLATLGSSTEAEDRLTFKIRVNNQMGEDAIVGKALSKLFSRVLMRLEGKIMPESTDVSGDDVVEGEVEAGSASDLADKIKENASKAGTVVDAEFVDEEGGQEEAVREEEKAGQGEIPCPYCTANIQETVATCIKMGVVLFPCPVCFLECRIENGLPVKSIEAEPPSDEQETVENETTEDDFESEWNNLGIPGYSTYVFTNILRFKQASEKLRKKARDKWIRFYLNDPWPLDGKEEGKPEGNSGSPDTKADNSYVFCPEDGPKATAGKRVSFMAACAGCDKGNQCDPYQEYLHEQRQKAGQG